MARGRMASPQAALAKPVSASDFLPLLYGELRAIAAKRLRAERRNHTLQPTALVHEAFLKLRDRSGFQDEQHFLATAARAMRQILVDHARARLAAKRSGQRVPLSEASMVFIDDRIEDVLEIDRLLTKLAARDPLAAEIVQMRFFGGLKEAEIASHLGHSVRWVSSEWEFARAWLAKELDS